MIKRISPLLLAAGMLVVLGGVLVLMAFFSATGIVSAATPPPPEIPYEKLWAASAHAKADAEAFVHWNEEKPPEIPVTCAKCHSTTGFRDYVGADGSAAMKVDKAAKVGTVITCVACHNEATAQLSSVMFPSGAEIKGLGSEAVCMTCHQGTASKTQVDESIKKANITDVDKPVKELGFTNIHYFAAAVSRYGTLIKGGYEYDGKTYDALWDHVAGVQTCTDCHNSHSLELKTQTCVSCHPGVRSAADARKIRMASSGMDYDGDGNVKEGMYDEVDGLRQMLYTAIQAYAKDTAGTPLVYSPDAYPYFFKDTNANGKADKDEAAFPNAYNAWTARLAKAAYNYQTSIKDGGAYVHGGKYIIALLYDSIEDLNQKLAKPVDLSKAHRTDAGHFAGSGEAFRHWDTEGKVPGNCVKCHTGAGLPQFLSENATISMAPSNGLMCETCHNDLTKFTRYEVKQVTFPSGAKVAFEQSLDDNLCLNCHQGRESTSSVNKAVAGMDADTASDKINFRNVHYFAAGATLFGTEAKGVYEYEGKTYVGRFNHDGKLNTCTSCHDAHNLTPKMDTCKTCHQTDDAAKIRMPTSNADYDGDGNKTEGIKDEVETMKEQLYVAIQAYAKEVSKTPIAYSPSAYPYFFVDTNGNGKADAEETKAENGYKAWTPRLLKAAYNYQYVNKDPGAFVHNARYMLQVLYDSIADLGSKVKVELKGTRP